MGMCDRRDSFPAFDWLARSASPGRIGPERPKRPILVLAAGLGTAFAMSGMAQAQGFAPCGALIVASGRATSPSANPCRPGDTFDYRVILMPSVSTRLRMRFNMHHAARHPALNNPLNLRSGHGSHHLARHGPGQPAHRRRDGVRDAGLRAGQPAEVSAECLLPDGAL